jgi:hypothetical protein
MANVEGIYISLTFIEAQAVYTALGKMCGKDYTKDGEAAAVSRVYSMLTPFLGDDE